MATKLLLAFFCACFATSSIYAGDILYARYPALSPDEETIAFSYQGDIWSVPSSGGEARRLTVHEADDILPFYSPDGQWLMFCSRRFDNYDLFVMPANGGEAKQLTQHTSDDFGSGWFPGSDSVIFTSERDGRGDVFKVSIHGGAPIRLVSGYPEREYDGKLSTDGRYLVFTTGSGYVRWWRRDLRSAANTDIYALDRSASRFSAIRLTNHPTHEICPVVNSSRSEVYFVANYDNSWSQIYRVPLAGGNPLRLTNFDGDGVQWLNGTPNGSKLVFEQGFKIWTLDPQNNQVSEIRISVNTDDKINMVEKKILDNAIQWFSVSPDNKKIAVVMHGEVFVIPAEDPVEARQISHTSAREHHAVWGADSRTIYYCSDRDGDYQIYSADAVTGAEQRLTNSSEAEMKPLPSPDGKYLAFYRGTDKIVRLDLAANKEEVWVQGGLYDFAIEETMEFDWSPDSKWLTFTNSGPTYETDIWVKSIDGRVLNISKFAGYNFRPQFSDDGKFVYFTSTFSDQNGTFKVELQKEPIEFFESTLDSLFMESAKKDTAKTSKSAKPSTIVTIDSIDIHKRRKPAFKLAGENSWPVLTPDGKTYFFVASLMGKPEIWSVEADDDSELKQLTTSGKRKSQLSISEDGKKLYFLEDGKLRALTISDGKSSGISVKAVLEVDASANYRQKFLEAWRLLKNYFYDPTYRGIDWNQTRQKYEPVLAHIKTDEAYRDLMLELMGELRGSHLDLVIDESKPSEALESGETGILFDPLAIEREDRYRIKQVIALSPAAQMGIRSGQYVVAIDGVSLSRELNVASLLNGKVGERLRLSVADSPGGTTRDVEIKPVAKTAMTTLRYNDWVESRRRIVDSLSDNRIAYLHIRSMNQTALNLFREQLVAIAESKDAMIVDVRENPGGSIAVHLLGMLARTPWFLRSFRDLPTVSENKYRSKAFERPMACLINGYSGSNAEIFAEGFRRHKLGPIVGTPTGGAVIGTAEYYLIDGTHMRRPSWGAYTLEMEDTDLVPRQPDIFVENLPNDLHAGRDLQLETAVSELMKQLE